MTNHSISPLTEGEIQEALDVARQMIKAGIPIFTAPPCHPGCGMESHPKSKHHYRLPSRWQQTYPSDMWLDKWEPGWALAAVGGHVADFLDVDPRNGGDVEAERIRAAGDWPRTFGRQQTPSGGYHEIISPTGEHTTHFTQGIDVQGGGPDGQGRGFIYLAPTIGVSKVTGELRPYRWEEVPDLDMLREWSGADDSIRHVVTLVQARKNATPVPRQREPQELDEADPFATAESMSKNPGAFRSADRSFTPEQAKVFIEPCLRSLQEAPIGQIEERANVAAATLSHFVPHFWTPDQAYAILLDNLSHTAYDPGHVASTWSAEKFRPVLDGRRPPLDPWVATLRPEENTAPLARVETTPGDEGLTTLEKFRRMVVGMGELSTRPAPEPLVYGLLDLNTEAWLIGAPGSLKSFVALDIAAHVGTGRDWQGHRVRKGSVLYIAAEGEGGMVLRTRAWIKEHGEPEGVFFLPYPVQVKSADQQWEALTTIAREMGPVLIVIDTQARVSVGLKENDATDMGVLIAAIGALKRATKACVLVVHHTGRNGLDARGSSALDGAQDTELKVVRGEPRSALACKILQDKQKDMSEGSDGGLRLQLKVVDLGTDPVTDRPLSSLVLMPKGSAFDEAQGSDVAVVRPWLPEFHDRDVWRRKIINALYDLAPVGMGLTKAEVRGYVNAAPKSSAFADAWKAVVEMVDPSGGPVVERVAGERYDLVSLSLLEALARENGPRGGQAPATGSAPAGDSGQ